MPREQFVRTRTPGWCDSEFAHPGAIQRGDIVTVTTYYPRGEHVRDFGVAPFTRTRKCEWCTLNAEHAAALRGAGTLRLRDRQGDIWAMGSDGLMHTRETAPFEFEHVERKWGPLHVVHESTEPHPTDGSAT